MDDQEQAAQQETEPYPTTYPGLSISIYEWGGWHVLARLGFGAQIPRGVTVEDPDHPEDAEDYPAESHGDALGVAYNVNRFVEANGELPAHMTAEPWEDNPWHPPIR